MKSAIVLAPLLALVAAVPQKRQDYPDCGTTTGDLYVPETIIPGEKFSARFCSSTYAKTSSRSITFAISAKGDTEINSAVILADELTTDDGKKYDFEATLPTGQIQFPEKTNFIVVEKINDYYVDSSYAVHTKEVKVDSTA
ncbi:hypothetical protein HDZ31DRAFT_63779 [Schizophyllum fasciatum]